MNIVSGLNISEKDNSDTIPGLPGIATIAGNCAFSTPRGYLLESLLRRFRGITGIRRLLNLDLAIALDSLQRLLNPTRPPNLNRVSLGIFAQAKMHTRIARR